MGVEVIALDDQYYLNYCTKFLARINQAKSPGWQFPLVDTAPDGGDSNNLVSFVYKVADKAQPNAVALIGTFANLYEPLALRPISFLGEATGFYGLSLLISQGQVHRYQFVVNGAFSLDPINPQRTVMDDGSNWSRFFTQRCFVPISFEEWELDILYRIFDQLLPFHNRDTENFLNRFYDGLDKQAKLSAKEGYYRLDASIGEVNFVDKLLAKEEIHHLPDYKICLREIDRLLRLRNPYVEPAKVAREFYVSLYDEMATGTVAGWNYFAYGNPRYFLQILRRHAVMAAFSHPKYGGNSGGAGWAYLAARYQTFDGSNLFDWRAALEPPLGKNADYLG